MEIIKEEQIPDYHKKALEFLNMFEKDVYFYGYPISKDFEMRLYCKKYLIKGGILERNHLNSFDHIIPFIQRKLALCRRAEFNKGKILKERKYTSIEVKAEGDGFISLKVNISEGNNHNKSEYSKMLYWKIGHKLEFQQTFLEDMEVLIKHLREEK